MAQVPGSNISAGIRPNDSADTYDTHSAEYGRGGYHTGHADAAARDAIPVERRQWWMLVPLRDGTKWELVPGYSSQNLSDNGNWKASSVGAATPAPVYWGALGIDDDDPQTILSYLAEQLADYEENWQPFDLAELPAGREAAAGLQLRPLLLYMLGLSPSSSGGGSTPPASTSDTYAAAGYVNTGYST